MKRTPFLTVLAGGVLMLASCKNENKTGLAIPKDAAMVFHVNPKSLSSKLSWEEIKKSTWFKDAYADTKDSFAQKMMNNPEASGVDLSKDFAYFIKKQGRGGYGVFEGSVKDATAFAALVNKSESKAKTEKDGDMTVAYTGDGVAVWNGSKFALVSNAQLAGVSPMMGQPASFGIDSLKIFAKQTLNDEGESLFEDDRFADVMKDDADMHFWMNAGSFYGDMAGMMSMMKVGALIEGNVTAGSFNFDDGKITGRFKQFYGKEMQKAIDKWEFKDIDAAALDRIASNNVIGVFAMNMNTGGLKEFLKTIGMDGMANMALSKQNLSLDEVLEASKGQFVMAFSDLQMKDTTMTFSAMDGEQPTTYKSTQPDFSFLFAASVNKKATFEKLVTMAKNEAPANSVAFQLTNDWFVAGNKADAVNSFAAGGNTKHAFTEKLSGHSVGFYLDIQRLLKTNFTKDAGTQSMLAESAALWKDVIMVSDKFKDGVATSEMTINFVDGKTNSLKQLNQYFEKLNALKKANKVAFENDMNEPMTDSMTLDAIPAPQVQAPAQ